jgi:hypothetical protein
MGSGWRRASQVYGLLVGAAGAAAAVAGEVWLSAWLGAGLVIHGLLAIGLGGPAATDERPRWRLVAATTAAALLSSTAIAGALAALIELAVPDGDVVMLLAPLVAGFVFLAMAILYALNIRRLGRRAVRASLAIASIVSAGCGAIALGSAMLLEDDPGFLVGIISLLGAVVAGATLVASAGGWLTYAATRPTPAPPVPPARIVADATPRDAS